MDDDEKAKDYLDQMRIALSKVQTIMMEAHRDGFSIQFGLPQTPPFNIDLMVTKVWK